MRTLLTALALTACAAQNPREVVCPAGTRLERNQSSTEISVRCVNAAGKPEGPAVVLELDGTLRTRSESGPDGQISSVTSFFKNGRPREESHWAHGAPDGLWLEWDETGREVRRTECERGWTLRVNGKVMPVLGSASASQTKYIGLSPQRAVVRVARIEEEFWTGAGGEIDLLEVVDAVRGTPGPWVMAGGHAQRLGLKVGDLYAVGIEPRRAPSRALNPSVTVDGYVTGGIRVQSAAEGRRVLEAME
jgi:hypothetical protein